MTATNIRPFSGKGGGSATPASRSGSMSISELAPSQSPAGRGEKNVVAVPETPKEAKAKVVNFVRHFSAAHGTHFFVSADGVSTWTIPTSGVLQCV